MDLIIGVLRYLDIIGAGQEFDPAKYTHLEPKQIESYCKVVQHLRDGNPNLNQESDFIVITDDLTALAKR